MGLFRFLADMDSFDKINKQYGIGAADEFVKNRDRARLDDKRREQEQIILDKKQNDYEYEKAVKNVIKEVKYKMNNQLRKNELPITDEEIKKLEGIIGQVDYVYDQKTVDEVCDEWNTFWYEKEFVHFVSIKVKDLESTVKDILSENKDFNKSKEKELSDKFDSIYNSKNKELFLTNLNEMIDYVKDNYGLEIDKKYLKEVNDEIKRVKEDWGEK